MFRYVDPSCSLELKINTTVTVEMFIMLSVDSVFMCAK